MHDPTLEQTFGIIIFSVILLLESFVRAQNMVLLLPDSHLASLDLEQSRQAPITIRANLLFLVITLVLGHRPCSWSSSFTMKTTASIPNTPSLSNNNKTV